MPSSSIFPFTAKNLRDIDQRLLPFTEGWKLVELYKGKTVTIPGDWDSHFKIINYFKVVKEATDHNAGEAENEIGLRIEGGWFPYDTEVIINLFISGKDVLSGKNTVHAEIFKAGGASMCLYHNDKLITNFTVPGFWGSTKTDKAWKNLTIGQ